MFRIKSIGQFRATSGSQWQNCLIHCNCNDWMKSHFVDGIGIRIDSINLLICSKIFSMDKNRKCWHSHSMIVLEKYVKE